MANTLNPKTTPTPSALLQPTTHPTRTLGGGRTVRTWALIALGLSWAQAARAAPETHDGFFLRLEGGLGKSAWAMDAPNASKASLAGNTTHLTCAIGGVLGHNLALHGTMNLATMNEPQQSWLGTQTRLENTTVTTHGLGVGVTWYAPINLYLTLSTVAMVGEFSHREEWGASNRSATQLGFAVTGGLGYEFWIADEWGLGLAAHYLRGSIPDEGGAEQAISTWSLGLSATFN